jgi:DNA-binding GntR family transcriptional regulator
MNSLTRTIRQVLHLTDCLNRELCVRYNEWAVLRAKQHLADALAARDRCRAAVAIAAHVEPAEVPRYLSKGEP